MEKELAKLKNEHFSLEEFARLAPKVLGTLEGYFGGQLMIEMLGEQKNGEDATTKILVRGDSGQSLAVIVCSRSVAPELVARGTSLAESIREILGEQLGAPIIRPIMSGYAADRSFVILPYCRELSSWKLVRAGQRSRLRAPLLSWLRDATARAASRTVLPHDKTLSFSSILRFLAHRDFLNGSQRNAVSGAIDRIDSGKWKPRHVIDHNDLWLGNIMLPGPLHQTTASKSPFVLIDWGGANPLGYGIYDLIRISRGLKLSNTALRRELEAHSGALQCELQDLSGHLLAAFGRLHRHLECWPETEFLKTFNACWNILDRALNQTH